MPACSTSGSGSNGSSRLSRLDKPWLHHAPPNVHPETGEPSMKRPEEFPRAIQELALGRQKNLCASCGTPIARLGNTGRADHKFGEGAQAHHVRHVKFGGTA